MNQTVGVGMRPNFGRTERSHPPMMPAMSDPPASRQGERRASYLENQRAD